MIEVQQLTKDYGTVVAVKDLSFEVGKGEIVGFLGPNGAGKSTTLRIVAGFLGATSGRVLVAGHDLATRSLEARRSIGYMPEASPLYPELRVREYLGFRAGLKQVPRRRRRGAIRGAMEAAGISDMADTLIGHLSRGYRQRVGLADALVASPPLLILDEPTAGLDPNQIREVRALIRRLAEEHTVLLSTHILSEVESTCDRAIVIHRGKLVASGSIDELRELRRETAVRLVLSDPDARARPVLEHHAVSFEYGARRDALVTVDAELEGGARGERLEALVSALVNAQVGVREASPVQASLEEVFAELTTARHRDEAADEAAPSARHRTLSDDEEGKA